MKTYLENKWSSNAHQTMLNNRPPALSAQYCENNFDFPTRRKGCLLIPLLPGFDILRMNNSWPQDHQRSLKGISVVQIVTIRNSDAHVTTNVT